MISIAIDIMGGDNAPSAPIEGAVQALDSLSEDIKLVLVGPEELIEEELAKYGKEDDARIEIRHADEVIEMDDPASSPIRKKKNSSVSLAAEEVKKGNADALVSAGHTGAAVAATVYKLRTLPGVQRPGIATVFPTPESAFLLIDAGANVGCKPVHLVQYGIMGEIYMREILGVENPRIGLLNVGDEVEARIIRIDTAERRLGMSLRSSYESSEDEQSGETVDTSVLETGSSEEATGAGGEGAEAGQSQQIDDVGQQEGIAEALDDLGSDEASETNDQPEGSDDESVEDDVTTGDSSTESEQTPS